VATFPELLMQRLPKRRLLQTLRFWPPYWGAGVRVVDVEGQGDAVDAVTVELELTALNRNALGTAFGGSLYAMADPWFLLLLTWKLGPGYVVWDKAASIEFVRPGRGTVRGRFEVTSERAEAVRAEIAVEREAEPKFDVELLDLEGNVVARVHKHLYARVPRRRR
jgi:acyl-coenzyme A thioesterase PaaI-like protein